LRVQVQLSKLARSFNRNMVEGIRGLTPSSSEISLPAELSQLTEMPRMATQNATLEHKPRAKSARTTIQKCTPSGFWQAQNGQNRTCKI